MAGTVANAHDDQFILRTRLFPRFLRPWLPVYGVVGVLQEVGAGFVDEGVGCQLRNVTIGEGIGVNGMTSSSELERNKGNRVIKNQLL